MKKKKLKKLYKIRVHDVGQLLKENNDLRFRLKTIDLLYKQSCDYLAILKTVTNSKTESDRQRERNNQFRNQ